MRSSRLHPALGALVAMVAVAGCGSSPREAMIAKGATPAYADGYEDGCSSGKNAAGSTFDAPSKDAARYATDSQYAEGWNDAFETCKREMQIMVQDARRRNPSRDR